MPHKDRSVLSLILGGGRGSRLFPLTKSRAKPAVPVAGKYRLIDIPISNCINSGLRNIYVLTQFLSVSLHRHIANTYKFDMFGKGFVEILAAQQANEEHIGWYQGTADAVRQNLPYIEREESDEILILSGDQLYRMDYRAMIDTHRDSGADVTIACIPVHESQTSGFGLMVVDDDGKVQRFVEKPKTPEARKPCFVPGEWIDKKGITSNGRNYLANMGIYLFNTPKLIEMLNTPVLDSLHNQMRPPHDFGHNVFPHYVGKVKIQAHLFDGFWEDLGTIKSYHEVSIALGDAAPPFDFFTPDEAIYTRMRNLPASKFDGGTLIHSLVSDGCRIGAGTTVDRCLLGVRAVIGADCRLSETVVIGSDGFETAEDLAENARLGRPNWGVGDGSRIVRAILDKGCRIGKNCKLVNEKKVQEADDPDGRWYIRDGIICVPRSGVVPDGTVI
ncbi:MAG: glucose-1-phosphate adenylyltransferase [Fimbriiglobus sp.]|jgi:glucose-1-phosphate adenylyltransferase|nr:glucose-1-phosphate adenylyltransferase [Fimbriiglobus sp.]